MNSDSQMAHEPDKPRVYLLDRPQRLGILPTYRFWNDRDNWSFVQVPQAVAAAVVVLVGVLALPLVLAVTVAPLSIVLGLGLFERYIRRSARKRRSLAAASQRGSLPPISDPRDEGP